MKLGSTLFLKLVVSLIGLVVLGLCVFLLQATISSREARDFLPVLLGMYIAAIPFFFALYQTWKLLVYIDKSEAFSDSSVSALKKIKYCAIAISAVYAVSMPYVIHVADKDDAPGFALLGFVIIFASIVIATLAAVLQKLLQDAIDIKSENDLTV
jgi:hypothetical protein